jgi:two-component system, LytTR family, response regulator
MPDKMTDVIKSIIVEDEAVHSNRLKKLLTATDSRIQVLGVCHSIEEAFTTICTQQPDVIFLDIKLHDNPRGGFDLLKKFKKIPFDVVFTTAHIDHNIEDIRRCGIDYLPKPYMPDELEESLKKLWEKRMGNIGMQQLHILLKNLVTEQPDDQSIWLKQSEGYLAIKAKDVIYCKSSNQYTSFFVKEENDASKLKVILNTKGIGIWEKDLAYLNFCRIHESFIVNMKYMTAFNPTTKTVTLKHVEERLKVSDTGKEKLLREIKKTKKGPTN